MTDPILQQQIHAERFHDLHKGEQPLVLFNTWDAGSSKTVAESGAPAIATGSWSVAEAQGYRDGQNLPLSHLLIIVERIVASVEVPVSVDFEAAYAETPDQLMTNIRKLIEAGAIGINFEDQIIGGGGLYSIEQQTERIAAIRTASNDAGVDLFINARTDLFLKSDVTTHASLIDEAVARAEAYQNAGASGFFVPWLIDSKLIETLVSQIDLPLNIMMRAGSPSIAELRELGVKRISFGPGPYRHYTRDLAREYKAQTQI